VPERNATVDAGLIQRLAELRVEQPHTCWHLLANGDVCIRESGHDPALHDHDPARDYQIALRHDSMGLDDIVVKDVAMFRMERMDDDYVWLACYLTDGQEIVFDLRRKGKTVVYTAREPLPNVVYEATRKQPPDYYGAGQ